MGQTGPKFPISSKERYFEKLTYINFFTSCLTSPKIIFGQINLQDFQGNWVLLLLCICCGPTQKYISDKKSIERIMRYKVFKFWDELCPYCREFPTREIEGSNSLSTSLLTSPPHQKKFCRQ